MQFQAEKTECSEENDDLDNPEPTTCQNRETEISVDQSQEAVQTEPARNELATSSPEQVLTSSNGLKELQELFLHSGDSAEDFLNVKGHWSISDDDLNFYRTLLIKKGSANI